jgi:hypothetical protein
MECHQTAVAPPSEGCAAPGLGRLTATDGDFVLSVSPSGRLLAASDSVATVLGWDLEKCAQLGLCSAMVDEAQQAALRQLLTQVLATGGARATVQLTGASGRLWVDVAAKHLLDEPGTPVYVRPRPSSSGGSRSSTPPSAARC